MNDTAFNIYVETKKLIKQFEQSKHVTYEYRLLLYKWHSYIDILDKMDSNYLNRYEQESFTPEQIDFICSQIGEWYLEWKHRIICDLEQGTHRLGYAKEQLKTLICGE